MHCNTELKLLQTCQYSQYNPPSPITLQHDKRWVSLKLV